eukprot:2882563-Pyramimonas_sp.AAC.1
MIGTAPSESPCAKQRLRQPRQLVREHLPTGRPRKLSPSRPYQPLPMRGSAREKRAPRSEMRAETGLSQPCLRPCMD